MTRTLIIGGGLSGLALADALETQNLPYQLVEARDRFGGRILTRQTGGQHFDMGPAWFWPGQPRMAALIDRFGLRTFEQFVTGDLTFEDQAGTVQRGRGYAAMQGSLRLDGGMAALITALADALPAANLRLNAQVSRLRKSGDVVTATLADGTILTAARVVLALPPRIAADIIFDPPLPDAAVQAMRAVPTWMAGQAKAVAVYDTPFWRTAGLSGDAMSRRGPMVEIHDASPLEGGPSALFGFIGLPALARQDEDTLRGLVLAQLTRLFGPEAASPTALHIKDWAADAHTATPADHAPLYAHPAYGLPDPLNGLWDGQFHFAGTEVAPQFGGFLEGALEAADTALRVLSSPTPALP